MSYSQDIFQFANDVILSVNATLPSIEYIVKKHQQVQQLISVYVHLNL